MLNSFHGFVPTAYIKTPPSLLEAGIKSVVQETNCGCPVYSGWPTNLWSKPYDEIVEFLLERFETTPFVAEYYLCILYLGKSVEKEYLYVPFNESPQHMKQLGVYTDIGVTKKTRLKGFKSSLTSSNKTRRVRSFKA